MSMKLPNQWRVALAGEMGDDEGGAFVIPVGKLQFRVIASMGFGWEHLSISLPNRCPDHEEMCLLASIFWDSEDLLVQFRPRGSDYVNYHPFCLHWWRSTESEFPSPHYAMVGPRPGQTAAQVYAAFFKDTKR